MWLTKFEIGVVCMTESATMKQQVQMIWLIGTWPMEPVPDPLDTNFVIFDVYMYNIPNLKKLQWTTLIFSKPKPIKATTRGSVKLIFTSLIDILSLEESHHKPMGM